QDLVRVHVNDLAFHHVAALDGLELNILLVQQALHLAHVWPIVVGHGTRLLVPVGAPFAAVAVFATVAVAARLRRGPLESLLGPMCPRDPVHAAALAARAVLTGAARTLLTVRKIHLPL